MIYKKLKKDVLAPAVGVITPPLQDYAKKNDDNIFTHNNIFQLPITIAPALNDDQAVTKRQLDDEINNIQPPNLTNVAYLDRPQRFTAEQHFENLNDPTHRTVVKGNGIVISYRPQGQWINYPFVNLVNGRPRIKTNYPPADADDVPNKEWVENQLLPFKNINQLVQALEARVQQAEQTVAQMQNTVNQVQQIANDALNEAAQAKAQITQLQGELNTANGKIAALEQQNTTLNGQIQTLEQWKTTATNQIQALEQYQANDEQLTNALNQDVAQLKTDRDYLMTYKNTIDPLIVEYRDVTKDEVAQLKVWRQTAEPLVSDYERNGAKVNRSNTFSQINTFNQSIKTTAIDEAIIFSHPNNRAQFFAFLNSQGARIGVFGRLSSNSDDIGLVAANGQINLQSANSVIDMHRSRLTNVANGINATDAANKGQI